ncbi:hypothetical protein MBLNU230_g3836t1 [Neophaeotheca triangularis]
MKAFAILAITPLALCAAITKRTAEQVFNDITGIDTAVRALTAQTEAYNGGILQSKPVFTAAIDIHDINRQGFADAKASKRFTSEESKRIVQNVQDTVGVSIPAGLEVLKGKKDLFDEAELSSLVFSSINLLKYDHETFSAAVGAKLSLDQAPQALVATGKIDAALQAASLFYATPLTK